MANKRRPGYTPEPTPTYEDKAPAANKVTIASKTPLEKTIILQRPVGRESRKKVARLMPYLAKVQEIIGDDPDRARIKNSDFMKMMSDMWNEPGFEEEIIPFVLGLNDNGDLEWLEQLEFTDLMNPVFEALMYMAVKENTPELGEALKKSEGDEEPA